MFLVVVFYSLAKVKQGKSQNYSNLNLTWKFPMETCLHHWKYPLPKVPN